MTEFTTGATLELEVPQRELRAARDKIEDEIGEVQMSVGASGTSSGPGSRMLDTMAGGVESLVDLADDRNDLLEEILNELEDQGGGGGILPRLPGGGGGRRRGNFFPRPPGRPTIVPFPDPDKSPKPDRRPNDNPGGFIDPRNIPFVGPSPNPGSQPGGSDPSPGGGSGDPEPFNDPTRIPSTPEIIGGVGAGALTAGAIGEFLSGGGIFSGSSTTGAGLPTPLINPNTADLLNLNDMLLGPGGQRQQRDAALQTKTNTIRTERTVEMPSPSKSETQSTQTRQRKKKEVSVNVEVDKPDTRKIVDEVRRELDREFARETTGGIAGGGF